METNLMIIWKQKALEKKFILPKIKEMLKLIFPDTNDECICYSENNTTHFLQYKITKDESDTVYLKIECKYSEAKAATILSNVRDKICGGDYRKDYSIICTYDEASLSFCCRLMKPLGVFERRLRQVMYLTTVKAFGYDWVSKTFPNDLLSKLKDITNGGSDEKLTESAFEYLNYSDIVKYLFDEKRENLDEVIDSELSEENMEKLSKSEIIDIIKKIRKQSIWSKLFADNKDLLTLKDKIDVVRKYRNDTMHHHKMSDSYFRSAKAELRSVNKTLNHAVYEIERKLYAPQDYFSVLSVVGETILQMVKGICNAFDLGIANIFNTVNQVYEKLQTMIDNTYFNDENKFTKLFNANMLELPNTVTQNKEEITIEEKKKYHILQIFEEDYGCEGIPDGQEQMCSVIVKDENGDEKCIQIPDSYLKEHYLNEGDIIEIPLS